MDDPLHSPAMARLRRAHVRAQAVSLAVDTAQQPSTALPAAQPQLNSWAEHAPPRLDASVIAQLAHHKDFKTSYPGEFLDSDAMPSVRLLSITQMVCPARHHHLGALAAPLIAQTISGDHRVEIFENAPH